MTSTDVRRVEGPGRAILYGSLSVAILALLIAVFAFVRSSTTAIGVSGEVRPQESSLNRILRTRVIRAGYGGFPPYTILNPNEPDPSKRVSGFCVDIMEEIARRCDPPLHVEWSSFNWTTMRAELDQDRVDVLADIVYATIPRATDMGMTVPFSYVGIACGMVRADESRIKQFDDLERKDITIALAEGWASSEFAFQNLSRSRDKYLLIPAGDDASVQLDAVLNGRADIALNDVPSILQYVKNHPGKVKALWLGSPPSLVGGGFVTRHEDLDLLAFLDEAIRILQIDGTIRRLDQEWKTFGHFQRLDLDAGAGLKEQ